MKELRLSIIIPFYNVEKYIAQSLDSVYAQDIPESEYEVICVNDFSPDRSRQIVLDYQQKHKNLILVEHEKNKMLGAARNTGLRAARGKYVWFIDSDDYIKENVFGKLLDIAERNELEILHFNMQKDAYKEISWNPYFPYNTKIITGIDYLNIDYPYSERINSAWTKLFKKDFLYSNQLFYVEDVYWEDNVTSLKGLLLVSKFMYMTDRLYIYRINENSITQNNRKGGKKIADEITYCLDCIALLEKYKKERFVEEAIKFYLSLIVSQKYILYLPLREKIHFCKNSKRFNKAILKKYFNPLKERLFYVYPIIIYSFSLLRPLRQFKHLIIKKR